VVSFDYFIYGVVVIVKWIDTHGCNDKCFIIHVFETQGIVNKLIRNLRIDKDANAWRIQGEIWHSSSEGLTNFRQRAFTRNVEVLLVFFS
jgi:hypothetical protein